MRDITYVIDKSAIPNFSEGVTVFDNFDGNITSTLVVDSSAVDLTTPGTYTVIYVVSDISGNEAVESITVTVVDLTALTITGIISILHVLNEPEPDYLEGITATDNVDGDIVTLEYKFYDVETSWSVEGWIKNTLEAIFNSGEDTDIFELELVAVSGTALNEARDNGDFEMTLSGWQGLENDAPALLGQVYNSNNPYMLEVGFDTANAEVTVALPNTKIELIARNADFVARYPEYIALYDAYVLIENPTEQETSDFETAIDGLTEEQTPSDMEIDLHQSWEYILTIFIGDNLTTTYNQLFLLINYVFYNSTETYYEGQADDFDHITAAMETVLLDQMIAIPLFSSVETTVYSNRIVFEADSYHARMGWGGIKYMYIGTEQQD